MTLHNVDLHQKIWPATYTKHKNKNKNSTVRTTSQNVYDICDVGRLFFANDKYVKLYVTKCRRQINGPSQIFGIQHIIFKYVYENTHKNRMK